MGPPEPHVVVDAADWLLRILGGLAVAVSLWTLVGERLGYYTWLGVRSNAMRLVRKIRDDGFVPEIVVGLGRSGAILGGIMAGNLGVLPIATVDRKYRYENGIRIVIPLVNVPRSAISGKRVLLVDAVPHTGQTLHALRTELMKFQPADLRTASLYVERVTTIRPNYLCRIVPKVRRLPWRNSEAWREDFVAARQ